MTASKDLLSKTRGQSTYQAILTAIRDGIYRPGDPLREEEVATRLGVSRTPVREALGRLQEKGLLEGVVARFAARHATEAEIANLERLNARFAASEDPKVAAQWNRQFHARLYDAARNRYLRQAVEDLQETIALLPDTTFIQPGRTTTATDEHVAIIEAIRRRDSEGAEKAAVGHIKAALEVRLVITRTES
jgi:DNA-binding GntR family transcriptional regulator